LPAKKNQTDQQNNKTKNLISENLSWEQKKLEKVDVKSDEKNDECDQESDTAKNHNQNEE
jgi:hypothetical protein